MRSALNWDGIKRNKVNMGWARRDAAFFPATMLRRMIETFWDGCIFFGSLLLFYLLLEILYLEINL